MVLLSQSIQDNIFKYRLQHFLSQHNQTKSGNTNEIKERIQNLLESSRYRESFEQFLKQEFKYGKNKQIFYTHLSLSDVTILRDIDKIIHLLALKEIFVTSFNNLLKLEPVDNDILYLDIISNNNRIQNIEMCIYKEIASSSEESDEILTNYVWIELNIQDRYLNVRLRPQINMADRLTPRRLYLQVLEQLREIFKVIIITRMGNSEETLYKMYKEYITRSELPYRELVENMSSDIIQANKSILSSLQIPENSELFNQIIGRYKRLIERMLIVEDLENYNTCHNDREALVERIAVADDSGATANVLSGDQDGLDVATIYFDIRETIDSLGRLKKLWIKWFIREQVEEQISIFPEESEETRFNFHSYSTKIECFPTFILISFMKEQYIDEKISEYVFSCFRRFEEG